SKLDKTTGVERVEMQPLGGGATLLIHGDVSDEALVKSAKSAGYDLWPLNAPRRTPPDMSVTLPTLTPEAGRSTPPNFEARVLEERAILGQRAPDFTVKPMGGGPAGNLADYLAGGKPVVLIFGSCT